MILLGQMPESNSWKRRTLQSRSSKRLFTPAFLNQYTLIKKGVTLTLSYPTLITGILDLLTSMFVSCVKTVFEINQRNKSTYQQAIVKGLIFRAELISAQI